MSQLVGMGVASVGESARTLGGQSPPLLPLLESSCPCNARPRYIGARRKPGPVRAIIGISCLLLGAALWLCQVEDTHQTGSAEPYVAVQWVRTVDGWERPDSWRLQAAPRPSLHPLLVAAGQSLLSALGLVLFQRDES
jgi:hypothetical protein